MIAVIRAGGVNNTYQLVGMYVSVFVCIATDAACAVSVIIAVIMSKRILVIVLIGFSARAFMKGITLLCTGGVNDC